MTPELGALGRGAWQLSPLEVAAGFPLDLGRPALVTGDGGGRSARAAFEHAVRTALEHPPCVVSFSGGRDSSAVLAVAADLARREGHRPPVAVSLRFARVPSAEESAWQAGVVDALGVTDWEQVELDTELDLVGEVAAAEVRRHGVLWPANTHFHAPVADRARGGTLLTGFGGDEIMSPGWQWDRANWVLTRRTRPRPADAPVVLAALAPAAVRRAVVGRRPDPAPACPWLTPAASARALAAWRDLRTSEPVRHDRAVREHWWRSRYLSVCQQSLHLLAQGHGARVVHPFADPGFLDAAAAERGRAGPVTRTRAMSTLFGDLLPRATIVRRGKASFNGAFWGPAAQAFAGTWGGSGVDPALVDAAALQREWRRPDPDARTYSLLQAAWAHHVAGAATRAPAVGSPVPGGDLLQEQPR